MSADWLVETGHLNLGVTFINRVQTGACIYCHQLTHSLSFRHQLTSLYGKVLPILPVGSRIYVSIAPCFSSDFHAFRYVEQRSGDEHVRLAYPTAQKEMAHLKRTSFAAKGFSFNRDVDGSRPREM